MWCYWILATSVGIIASTYCKKVVPSTLGIIGLKDMLFFFFFCRTDINILESRVILPRTTLAWANWMQLIESKISMVLRKHHPEAKEWH
jgi:hypothetical protein